MARNAHVLCSCRKQPLPHCGLEISYTWAHLLAKNMNKCTHLATCSSRFDLKTSASTHDCSCCKDSPVQSEWHRSIYGNCLFVSCSSEWLWCTGLCIVWVVPVNAIESYSNVFCLQENVWYSLFCFGMLH